MRSIGAESQHAYGPGEAGVRSVVLDDGPARGLRMLEVRSGGGLSFDVLVDRGLDIGDARLLERSFGWRSPGGYPHPAFFSDSADDGFGWLRSFSGLLMTGGLDHIFSPGTEDAAHFAHPPRARRSHPLHGRIAHTPAEHCRWGQRVDGDVELLTIRGRVTQFALAGEHLVLDRRIDVPVGGREIRITDRVTNLGFEATPHGLLYHVNAGWPLLSEHTVVDVADPGETVQLTPEPPADPRRVPAPAPATTEVVHRHTARNGPAGRAAAAFRNPVAGLELVIDFDAQQLPVLVQWVFARSGQYVAALEPSTHAPGTPHRETMIGPGESREYGVRLQFGSTS